MQYNDITKAGKMLAQIAGCSVTMENKITRIKVIAIKKVLSPKSCPDGVNQWKKSPEKLNVA